jgi:hypothetical protein
MDYHQTTERYRKREFRSQVRWGIRILLAGAMLWIGWFFGNTQQSVLVSFNSQQLIDANQKNERLEQELASLNQSVAQEKERRVAAELLINEGGQKEEMQRLSNIIARYLSHGIEEDQIKQTLQTLSQPSRCRPVEEKDIAVATPYFVGKESKTGLLDNAFHVFVEGVTEEQATEDQPWLFDPKEPVSLRVAFLGGEKITSGVLPLSMNIIADTWLMKLDLIETSLQGYVNVRISKCSFN